MKIYRPALSLALLLAAHGFLTTGWTATDLRQATVKEVVNDVTIIPAHATLGQPAHINDLFKSPDLIRTGANSRAELLAADETVARVGANTIFSFEPVGRTINLQQGTILFNAPHGHGGGIIQTAAATAAVTGTTIIVCCTKNGGFKTIVLEGRCRISLPNGNRLDLTAGQLSFVLPGSRQFSAPINIDLGPLTQGCRLLHGFKADLGSQEKIQREVSHQSAHITEKTKLEVGEAVNQNTIQVIDSNTLASQVQTTDDTADRFKLALKTDATIVGSTLDSTRIFDLSKVFQGLYGTTPSYFSNNYQRSDYLYFASNNLDIFSQSVTIPNAPGGFAFLSTGNINFRSSGPSNTVFSGSTPILSFMTISPGGALGGDITVNGPLTFNQSNVEFYSGHDFKTATTMPNLALKAGSPGGSFTVLAQNQLGINGISPIPTILGFTNVNLWAHTVVLTNFSFTAGVNYNLGSSSGQWNGNVIANSPAIPGQTNLRATRDSGGTFIVGSGAVGPITNTAGNNINSVKVNF
jgi:hypothetical protein